jgi:mycofactocin biosynthetic radical S-adenosylmethionine protein MftC
MIMSNYQATIHAPFVLVPQYFGSTVFDRSSSKYLPFDHETTELLKASRTKPFFELLDGLDAEAAHAAIEFYQHFYDLRFFSLNGLFWGEVLELEAAQSHLSSPLAVHLEVMAACNLTCKHCFAGELPRKEERLSLKEIEALFEDMAKMGSYRLGLTGGEPLLHPQIFEIIDMAIAYGLHPCLTTNALLITEEIAREFGKREMLWLNVSLEGATAGTNDAVRGSGTFAKVVEKLQILSQYSRFTLAFTIMKTNAEEVLAFAKLGRELGASTVVFRPLYPVGVSQHFLDSLMPSFEQYNTALNLLADLQIEEAEADLRSIDPFSPSLRADNQAVTYGNHGCGAGNTVCSISVSGNVNPCSFLGEGFAVDNIRQRPLSEIWRKGQKFTEIRAYEGGTAESFSGGCRARSLVFEGSANAPDPWLNEKKALAIQPRQSNVRFFEPLDILQVSVKGD